MRNVHDAITNRYNAMDKGEINYTAISTTTNEKPQIITMKINSK